MKNIPAVRPSPIAGSWYPRDEKTLRTQIEGYLQAALPPEVPGSIAGLIAPHAGYLYSGPTAGYSYHCVKGQTYDLVVVASPLHDYLPYPFMTSAHASYATPLGEVPIDHEVLEEFNHKLSEAGGPTLTPIANDREHSLEIQLPFLQCALAAPFHLLPLMIRAEEPAALRAFAEILALLIDKKRTLLVASTDLSHFYTEEQANQLDEHMLAQFAAFSPEGVLQAEKEHTGFACGASAVAAVLWTAKAIGAKKVTLLHHSTSAAATYDTSEVVGYGAAAISY